MRAGGLLDVKSKRKVVKKNVEDHFERSFLRTSRRGVQLWDSLQGRLAVLRVLRARLEVWVSKSAAFRSQRRPGS